MHSAIARTAAVIAMVATIATVSLLAAATGFASPAAAAGQTRDASRFATPEQAVQALIEAARADDPKRLMKVLGHGSRKLVDSGDAVADRQGRAHLVAAYDQAHRLDAHNGNRAVLVIGEKQWPFPIPLVRSNGAWRFDTRAGAREILDRRIGRNELGAIEVCRAYVDAQRDFAAQTQGKDGLLEYAQHFMSTPGRHDGLYWPAAAGEPESPMGPLVAAARAEGYGAGDGEHRREPYHGYYYRILKRQGPAAADGARDYLVNGRMIGGFALVAFPARYGDSGIMSFIVNQDGIVYQKNLGKRTEEIARGMAEFDPDATWTKAGAGLEPVAAAVLAGRPMAIEPGRGELLYSTECLQCHTEQVHWRDKRLARDWTTLQAEVRRWQRFQKLRWSTDDVDLVARYLNAMYYHYAAPDR